MQFPEGYYSSGLAAGIKGSGAKDLALIYSELPAHYAGTFTQNSVKAHCVIDNIETLEQGNAIRAIIINSGNANACTGPEGLQNLKDIKAELATQLHIEKSQILTASTGVIGQQLPVNKILSNIPNLQAKLSRNGTAAAEAILTTDLTTKASTVDLGSKSKAVGIAKGSGMIHPNMATMLGFIMIDAMVLPDTLQKALGKAVEHSFNQISVDGDTSTNDMVIALANGATGETIDSDELERALTHICQDLAKQIAQDGEGATKLIEVQVKGLKEQEALKAAKGIVSSSLVKSAIFGNDPNWGRILSAAGQHTEINQAEANLKILEVELLKNGQPTAFDKAVLSEKMKAEKEIIIEFSIGESADQTPAYAWGCDLSYDYVKINAEYTT